MNAPTPAAAFLPPLPGFAAALGVYATLLVAVVAWYVLRRNLQPVKARGMLLTMFATAYGLYDFFVLCLTSRLDGTTCAVDVLNIVSASLFFPMWALPIMLRALELTYRIHLGRETIGRNAGSWLLRWRPVLLSPWAKLAVIFAMAGLELGLSVGLPRSGLLGDNGPCNANINLPIFAAFGALYVVILAVISFLAFRILDVYLISREMAVELVIAVVFLGLWIVAQAGLIQTYGSIFVLLAISISSINILVVPIYYTYHGHWRVFNEATIADPSYSGATSQTDEMSMKRDASGASLAAESDGRQEQQVSAVHSDAAGMLAVLDARKPSLDPRKKSAVQGDVDVIDSLRLIDFLRNTAYLRDFEQFCVRAFCAETIGFFLEMQAKHEIERMDKAQRTLECRRLFDYYIVPGAPMELNLTDKLRRQVTAAHKERPDDVGLFEPVQRDVYYLMKTSLFPAWKRDASFVRLMRMLPPTAITRPSVTASDMTITLDGLQPRLSDTPMAVIPLNDLGDSARPADVYSDPSQLM